MGAAIGAVKPHRDQALARGEVDAIGIVREMRPAAPRAGLIKVGSPPCDGNPDQVETRRRVKHAFVALAPGCAKGHDPLAVGRPDRIAVERRACA